MVIMELQLYDLIAGTECGVDPEICLLHHVRVLIVEHLPACIGLAFHLSESRIDALHLRLQLSTSGVDVKSFQGAIFIFRQAVQGSKKAVANIILGAIMPYFV
jgi:hypothetical protein